MITIFYIARHGQTEWNLEGRIQGHTDIPLNSAGRREAVLLREEFEEISFDVCYASDLQRAAETARLLRPDALLQTDKRLRERNFGSYEGGLFSAIAGEREGTESDAAMVLRIFSFLEEMVATHQGKKILAVSHGGLMRVLLGRLLSIPSGSKEISIKNTAFLQLLHVAGKWNIEAITGIDLPNYVVHGSNRT